MMGLEKRAKRKSRGRNRSPAEIAQRKEWMENRIDKTNFYKEGAYTTPSPIDTVLNPYGVDLRPKRGFEVPASPSAFEKEYPLPGHFESIDRKEQKRPAKPAPKSEDGEPDKNDRMAWAKWKYQRLKRRTTPASFGFYDPAGVVSHNKLVEDMAERGITPVRVTGPWPGKRSQR